YNKYNNDKGKSLIIKKNAFRKYLKQVVAGGFKDNAYKSVLNSADQTIFMIKATYNVYLDTFWEKLPREAANFGAAYLERLCWPKQKKKIYTDRFTNQWFAKNTLLRK
ncbi:unnamed protein product, partial [Cunninghamella blakesleeana]